LVDRNLWEHINVHGAGPLNDEQLRSRGIVTHEQYVEHMRNGSDFQMPGLAAYSESPSVRAMALDLDCSIGVYVGDAMRGYSGHRYGSSNQLILLLLEGHHYIYLEPYIRNSLEAPISAQRAIRIELPGGIIKSYQCPVNMQITDADAEKNFFDMLKSNAFAFDDNGNSMDRIIKRLQNIVKFSNHRGRDPEGGGDDLRLKVTVENDNIHVQIGMFFLL
jgi:hypothetical protein